MALDAIKRKRRDMIREFVDVNGLRTFSTKGAGAGPSEADFERSGNDVHGAVVAGPSKKPRRKAKRYPDQGNDFRGRRRVA